MTSPLADIEVGRKYRCRDGQIVTVTSITGSRRHAVAYTDRGISKAVWAAIPDAGRHSRVTEYGWDLIELLYDREEPEQLQLF